jgi:hypothetical protein
MHLEKVPHCDSFRPYSISASFKEFDFQFSSILTLTSRKKAEAGEKLSSIIIEQLEAHILKGT